MSERVKMPALGESVTEGTVTRWLKQVGEQVEVDEPLLEVSTDKVDTEIPSPVAGTLQEVLVGEDETVPVGADLAVIGDGAAADGGAGGEEQAPQEQATEQATEQPTEQVAEPSAAQEPDATTSEPEAAQSEQSQAEQQQAEQSQSEQQQQGESDGGGAGGGTTVTMPALGESVTEGTVTRWLKAEGDTVEVDEPLLEVSTDKVDTEIPSPAAGTITKLLVAEDETVPVGADLAVIGGGASSAAAEPQAEPQQEPQEQQEQTPAAQEAAQDQQQAAQASSEPESAPEESASTAAQTQTPQPTAAPAAPAAPAAQPAQAEPAGQQPAGQQQGQPSSDASTYVTPLVRKLAAEHGVDLASISGTGVGGRVRKQDVLDAAEAAKQQAAAPQPSPAAPAAAAPARPSAPVPASVSAKRGTTEKMTRLRRLIAQRMVESLQTSAQLTTVIEVDVTKIARLRDRAKNDFAAREGVKLSFLPFFAQAAVEALKAHPTVNASVEGDEIVYHAQENLGIAVDTDKGLIVPVIRDAGDLNIAGIARKISDLAERTRANKIAPDELGGGTFTLTNTGSRGALFDTPIINQPQVGILGTGAVVKRPVVVRDADGGETIAIRSMVYLALSYDHRIVDGADAARFLVTMKERLEEGAFEADLGL